MVRPWLVAGTVVDDATGLPVAGALASVGDGRGLGDVAVVTSRTGRSDDWCVGGELSLIHAGALAEGPGPLNGSWLVGARRSYFDAIVRAASLDLVLVPRYGDARLRWESGDGRWMAIAFGSGDLLTLVNDAAVFDLGGGGVCHDHARAPGSEPRALGPAVDFAMFVAGVHFGERAP